MERLTCRRNEEGFKNANVLLRGKRFGPAFFPDKEDYQDYSDALERLAQYEDTGLAPEEIHELTHNSYGPLHKKLGFWIDADRKATLRIMPCKPGDMVWRICGKRGKKHVAKRRVDSIEYTVSGEIWIHSTACDVFGKTVFLTREEAEAALKGESNA